MAAFRKIEKEVAMVVDRSGIHRAHKLDATLDHYHDKFRHCSNDTESCVSPTCPV
jgi:hypothetical protein